MKEKKLMSQATLIGFLSFMGFISQFSIESYLSGIEKISIELNTSNQAIQHTIILFLFSYAISQLFYGPISDFWGRKKTLLLGFNIFGIGTIVCIFAYNINIFTLGRLLQGLGIGASFGLFRVVLSDHFQGRKLASVNSLLSVIASLTPPLSPFIGAVFITWGHWRLLFIMIMILTMIFIYMFHYNYHDVPQNIKHQNSNFSVIKKYFLILKNYKFCGYLLCSGLAAGAINAYTIATPTIFHSLLSESPLKYTLVFIFIAPSIGLGAYLNSKYVLRSGMASMMKVGSIMMVVSSLISVFCSQFYLINFFQIIVLSITYFVGTGLLFPNIYATSIRLFNENHGMVSAIYGASQVLVSGVISELTIFLKSKLTYVNLIQLGISVIVFLLIFKLSNQGD